MTALFVDSGFFIALDDVDDQHHVDAVGEWTRLRRVRHELVTSSMVLTEVVTFFGRRDHARAVAAGSRMLGSAAMRLVHVDAGLLRAGFEYFRRRPDKRYSLTDCVSFVLMERLGIAEALAFDAHFTQAGFVRLPQGG